MSDKTYRTPATVAARENLAASCFSMLAEGRMDSLGSTYSALRPDLFKRIFGIVRAHEDAEDVLHDVFVRLAVLGPKAVTVERPLGYLFIMARNEALKTLAKSRPAQCRAPEAQLALLPAPTRRETAAVTREEVERALAALPLVQRETIRRKIYEGLTFAQIGELMNVSPHTAASRYRYGLAKLADRFAPVGANG